MKQWNKELKTELKQCVKAYEIKVKEYKKLYEENKRLQNNRDKAIEVIDLITPELWNISNKMTYRLKDIKYILKGDSDE